MMRKQIGYFVFFAFVCAACFSLRPGAFHQAAAEEKPANSVDDLAKSLVDADLVKGVSVGIVTFDDQGSPQTKTLHFGTVRTKSGASSKPHTPTDQTLYELGSISKVFTGTLLAAATKKGEVEFGTTAQSLMPDGSRVPTFADRPITLVDLSLHRSGLPRLPDNFPSASSETRASKDPKSSDPKSYDPYAEYTSKLATEFLNEAQLTKMPGKEYEYSNFAVSYLGYLLTRAAKAKDYDSLLSQRLTGPLDMSRTGAVLADEAGELAIGHNVSGDETSPWHFADMPGAGGVRSSVEDLNKFIIACIDPPEDEVGEAINMAFKKHSDPLKDEFAMGLGWMIARDGSTRFHNGQTGGYHASIFVSRNLKLGVCVLANTAEDEVSRIAERIVQMKAGLKVMVPAYEKQVVVKSDVMDRYVGRYQLTPTFIFDVKRDGDRLMVGITDQPTHRVYPRSETVWFYRAVEAALRFGEIKNGKAQTVTLLQNGVEQTAERIED